MYSANVVITLRILHNFFLFLSRGFKRVEEKTIFLLPLQSFALLHSAISFYVRHLYSTEVFRCELLSACTTKRFKLLQKCSLVVWWTSLREILSGQNVKQEGRGGKVEKRNFEFSVKIFQKIISYFNNAEVEFFNILKKVLNSK